MSTLLSGARLHRAWRCLSLVWNLAESAAMNLTAIRRIMLLAFLLVVTPFASQTQEKPGAAVDSTSRFQIPASDEGLPGAGPIRRYDWFRKLWAERRARWAARTDKDRGAVVLLGDSITQGWGEDFSAWFPGMKIANRGISGDTSRGVLIRMDEDALALQPAAVVLLIGTNDLEEKADPETIAGNFKLILAKLAQHNGKMPIVLCEVFPSSTTKNRPADKIKKGESAIRRRSQRQSAGHPDRDVAALR